MKRSLIYITAASHAEAVALGRVLVEEKLAACVNILPSITSLYWWEGKVEEGQETALIAKTTTDLVERVTARIGEIHSYSCPCVVALEITGGNPAFLHWIGEETNPLKA